jgi:hypothetical protein
MKYYMLVGVNPKTGNQVDQLFTNYQDALFAKENHEVWQEMTNVDIGEIVSGQLTQTRKATE